MSTGCLKIDCKLSDEQINLDLSRLRPRDWENTYGVAWNIRRFTSGKRDDGRSARVADYVSPIMPDYNIAMQVFIELTYPTSEQQKDSSIWRIKKDIFKISKIYRNFSLCSPFSANLSLRNINNTIIPKEDVNLHEYTKSVRGNVHRQLYFPSLFRKSIKQRVWLVH